MAIQKKNAKARLDKYYYLAKEKGYRARAAFKLVQLNKKHNFLQNAKCLIDLCAAPGSWMQVAAETMPQKSLIIGVDLSPIKPIPRTISFQDDITTDRCRATIRGHLKGWKADVVTHDGAPNVGTAWVQDAFSQNELVLHSLRLATDFLAPNGTFVTKVFRSKDSAKLEWIFKQLFNRVEQTKPPSSRNVSAETFYVCRGFKAPKHMDPRFLDPKHAFADVETATVNNEARVFNPERKKRQREGYEEGDYTQFHEAPASEFIQTQDPIKMLGSLNRLHFRQETNGDIALAALNELPETTEEVRLCCQDLKVLGRKEFKLLLRWRLKARDRFGFRQKKGSHTKDDQAEEQEEKKAGEEVATVESMDDELRLQEELQQLKDNENKSKRKDRRKENERKQKEILRMQMGMTTPADIGIDAAEAEGTFRLKDVDKAGDVRKQILHGRMVTLSDKELQQDTQEDEEELDSDEDGDELERQLDNMYEEYQGRKEARDSKARAKRARMHARGDDEFEGFESGEEGEMSDASEEVVDNDSDFDSEEDEEGRLTTDLKPRAAKNKDGLSGRATNFFQQDIFKDIDGMDIDEEGEEDVEDDAANGQRDSGVEVSSPLKTSRGVRTEEEEDDNDSASVASAQSVPSDWEEGAVIEHEDSKGKPNIDIITAEAMTMAHALASGKITRAQLLDDNFNKYSHRDVDGLPEWFLDDEGKHSKLQRPVTAAAAAAIKEKTRALNARPIKKVREAKARKTLRAARRIEKLKKKSDGLAEGGELSENDKAKQIAALMKKASSGAVAKKKRNAVKVVVAGGQNKGAGRPRGVKGKYKMVDARLKKDVRGLKRAEKRNGKKR